MEARVYKIYGLKASDEEAIKYIGVTSKDLHTRLKYHYSDIQSNIRTKWIKSVKARRATIEIVALDDGILETKIFQIEKDYIKFFKALGANLKNGTDGGDKPPIKQPTIRVKKISRKTGDILAIYNSIKEAANHCGTSVGVIRYALYSPSRYANGFKWEKANTNEKAFYNINDNEERVHSRPTSYKPVIGYTDNGYEQEFESINHAAKSAGVVPSGISGVLQGRRLTAGGFKWKYKRGDLVYAEDTIN